ncbi:MAG: hypothetical protein ACKON7_08210 [Planctomycetaceae bacterium]
MNGQPAPGQRLAAAILAGCVAGVAGGQVVVPPALGVPAAAGSKPSPLYDRAFAAVAAGDFADGLEFATQEYRGATKIGNDRWIDSIAAAAAVGECHFERGDFARAVEAYDEALALSAQQPDWLLAVQFPAQPPRAAANHRPAPWGRSVRQTVPAQLPAEVAIRWQAADPQEVLKRGGVLTAPFDQRIRAGEIVRALVIALYRRAEILGELGREATGLEAVCQALARRPAPPNHYSQAWIDVALGTALWSQGKADQAAPLASRGLTIGPGLDHPLTCWGLIVLGRISLDGDRTAEAAQLFEEATYAAAAAGDIRALEEAVRLAFAAHMLAGARGVPATILAAGEAIGPRDGLQVLRALLCAMRAEALAAAGDSRGAAAALTQIDQRLLGGEPGRAAVGAEAAYAAALAAFAAGDVAAGDASLGRAIGVARGRSTRLFQTSRVVDLVAAGSSLSDRQAEAIFERLLAPPTPRDFGLAPLATLAVTSSPRQQACDAWVASAARRGLERGSDAVLDPAEAARRDRWLAARPLGGRLVAAARLLAADADTLDPASAARRAAILGKWPDLGPLLERLGRDRATVAAAALAAGAAADGAVPREPPGGAAAWTTYQADTAALARSVAFLAAGREPIVPDFPPLETAAQIRGRLGDRQLILSFHQTDRGLVGALESRDRHAIWEVRQAAGLQAEIAQLARGIGLFDPQAAVGTDKLLTSDWRGPAGRIERMLFENSRVSLAEGIDELVIVPDGWLWYVPFELLPVSSGQAGGAVQTLGSICRIRYCPTRSLALTGGSMPGAAAPVGIVAGRMARSDDAAAIAARLGRITAAVTGAVPVAAGGPPAAQIASVFPALALFEESSGGGGAEPCLVPPGAGRAGISFPEWLAPPAKRPRVVLVPGMQTALADGLDPKSLPARPGDDLFLPATDLLAAGAQTALLARWRVGGGTCVALMTEVLREATAVPAEPREPPAELWRRAVDIVTAEQPDPAREPRLRASAEAVLADASHPFFWAGYLLVDRGSGPEPAAAPAEGAAP